MKTNKQSGFKKHAFLIMAHNDPILLKYLLSKLDYPFNDIYIHIDKKVDIKSFTNVIVQHSKVFFLSQRVDVRWGDLSQVECEYELYKTAFSNGPYNYYHLLSGNDLPLKSNEYIHTFFDIYHSGLEFVSISFQKSVILTLAEHTNYYYLFTSAIKDRFSITTHIKCLIQKYFVELQKLCKYKRNFNMKLAKGHQWNSITNDFCAFILTKEKEVMKMMKFVCCPDEIFLQTILYNSPFMNKIYYKNDPLEGSSLREIDWLRGNPYVWTSDDIGYLSNSPAIFARKFSSGNYEFIDKIINK